MLDSYHQIGIPPYCDMFNHSSTSAHTSLLCDVGVCSECGSLQPCQHDELDSNGRPERLEGIEPAYLARMAERGEGEQVDMRAERDISAGVEVFSCYEEGLTSAKALVGYGFAPSEPTRSRISWGPWDILDKSSAGRFIHIMKRGVITAELFGDDKEEDWEFSKPLFRPGGSAALGSFDLSMDGDGTLSIDLLTAIHARTFHKWRRGLDNFNDQDDAVIRDAKALQAVADAQLGLAGLKRLGDETGTLRPLIRAVVQLLEDRLGAAHRPELSPEEIEKEILVSLQKPRWAGVGADYPGSSRFLIIAAPGHIFRFGRAGAPAEGHRSLGGLAQPSGVIMIAPLGIPHGRSTVLTVATPPVALID